MRRRSRKGSEIPSMKQTDREELKGLKIPPAVLLREILGRWRMILLAAVLFAGLFGGYRYLRYVRDSRVEIKADYLTAELYDKAAAVTERKIESRKEYLAGSIIAELNPYQVPRADALVVLKGEQDVVDCVMQSLMYFINDEMSWSEFAEERGTEGRFLRELVTIGDYSPEHIFLVRIRHRTEEEAKEMMTYLLAGLAEYDAVLKISVGEHTYEVMDKGTYTGYDGLYGDWAETQFSRISTLESVLQTYRKKAAGARGVSPALPKSAILKYVVLGGVLGMIAAVFMLLVFIFLNDRLLDAREIKALYGIRNLAVFPPKKRAVKAFVLDRGIDAIGRDPEERIPEEERYRIAGEKLAAFAPDAGKFALIGDAPEKTLAELADALSRYIPGAVFTAAPVPDRKADSVKILREADAAVLVGEVHASRFKTAERLMELSEELGKTIAGSIVI